MVVVSPVRRVLALSLAFVACGPRAEPQAPGETATVAVVVPSGAATSAEAPRAPTPPAGTGACPPDEPEPTRDEPAGERPFVNVIPREQVPLTRSLPDREVGFDAVACQANQEVWRDAEGRVRVCTVARAVTVAGIDLAAGAYSHFHADGRPYQTYLARPHVLRTANGTSVSCAAEHVVLSKDGALEHCELAASADFGAVRCRGGESVAFHPEGELAAAVVDAPFTVAALGVTFPEGTRLSFYRTGALAGGWSREPFSLAGYDLRWHFSFHENGRLAFFTLEAPRTIQGNAFGAGAKVALRPDGSLRYAEYEVDSGFMPHGEPWNDTAYVRYDCHGAVTSRHVEHWQADDAPRFGP